MTRGRWILIGVVAALAVAGMATGAGKGVLQQAGFIASGTGAVERTGMSKLREVVSITDYGAVCDGVTNDSSAIQAALDASTGRRVNLPKGQCAITTGLTITSTTSLMGEGSSSSDTTNTSTLLYSGTAAALTIGASGQQIKNVRLGDFQVKASGSATSSATAIGLKLINANSTHVSNVSVQGFGGGIGINSTATTGQIASANTFVGGFVYNNLIGYKFDGFDATHGDYASTILGGVVIGVASGTAGGKCLYVTQYAANLTVYGTDFETAEYPIDLEGNGTTNGGSVRLIGTRTEFHGTKQIRINATADRTLILGHRFTGGVAADQVSDSGTRTVRMDADAAVRMNDTALTMSNNIPIKMLDTGGTDRQVLKVANNDTLQIGTTAFGNYPLGVWNFGAALVNTRTALTYSAAIAVNAALGNFFDITATNGVAFTVNNPSNAADGQPITVTIRNTSGGALGALTWDTLYKAPAWTQPATGFSRSAAFKYNGTNWVQLWQSATDVPN